MKLTTCILALLFPVRAFAVSSGGGGGSDPTRVSKAGDTMTGDLTMSGAAQIVGGSSITAANFIGDARHLLNIPAPSGAQNAEIPFTGLDGILTSDGQGRLIVKRDGNGEPFVQITNLHGLQSDLIILKPENATGCIGWYTAGDNPRLHVCSDTTLHKITINGYLTVTDGGAAGFGVASPGHSIDVAGDINFGQTLSKGGTQIIDNGGNLRIGTGVKIDTAANVTAGFFRGDGSHLTGITVPPQVSTPPYRNFGLLPATSADVYWLFDEGAGTSVLDDLGRNGTLNGGFSWGPGQFGQAVTFDGTSGFADIPNSPDLNSTTAISIGAWANPVPIGDGSDRSFLSKGVEGSDTGGWDFEIQDNGDGINYTLEFKAIQNGGASNIVGSATTFQYSGMTHYAATWDGANVNFYVNGQFIETQPFNNGGSGINATNSDVLIGARSNGSLTSFFDGLIDEPFVDAQEILSAPQISSIAAQGLLGYHGEIRAARVSTNFGIAFSSTPVMHFSGHAFPQFEGLASGSTFFATVVDSAISLNRITVTVDQSVGTGSQTVFSCGSAAQGLVTVVAPAGSAVGSVFTAYGPPVKIPAGTEVDGAIASSDQSPVPAANVECSYSMQ